VDVVQKVIPKKKVKEKVCVWNEMQIHQVLNHPALCVPFLSHYFIPSPASSLSS
jgi:hypothetical protein